MALLASLVGQEIAPDQPFMEAGLDSLGAVELRNALSSKYSLDLPASLLFDYPNVASLSSYLAAALQPAFAPMNIKALAQLSLPEARGVEVAAVACHYPRNPPGSECTAPGISFKM